jgi:hypothetical protein
VDPPSKFRFGAKIRVFSDSGLPRTYGGKTTWTKEKSILKEIVEGDKAPEVRKSFSASPQP